MKEQEIGIIKNYIKIAINSKMSKGTEIDELDMEEISDIVKDKILSSLQNPKFINTKVEEELRAVIADFDTLFRSLFEEEIKERKTKEDIKQRLKVNIEKSGDIHKSADLFNQMIRDFKNANQGIISVKTNYEGNMQVNKGKEQKELQYMPIRSNKKRSNSNRRPNDNQRER